MKDLNIMEASQNTTRWPQVSIVLLNWNQLDLTIDCLNSLAKITYPNYEIILVDNGSTDGSPIIIKSLYPDVQIIENRENLGFSEANNVGMRYALSIGADYLLLLNNDTVVDPDFLNELIHNSESDPRIGILGPKMYYYDNPHVIWCAGNSIDWFNGSVERLRADEFDVENDHEEPSEVDYITACAIAVKRQVIDDIGLFDPRFFIYYEEADLCTRAKASGFQVIYVPKSKIWHKVSATMGTASAATSYYMARNSFLFIWRNLQGFQRWRPILISLFNNLWTMLAYTILPKNRHMIHNRNAILYALRDVLLGNWGKMKADVVRVCYPEKLN